MRRSARRALTPREKALAVSVFGERLDLEGVRILASPFDRAFVPGRWFGRDWIVWPGRRWVVDFAEASLKMQAVFIHELVHVWQAQNGVNLLLAKLRAGDGAGAYAYEPGPDCRWERLNIEQQAMVVEHAFVLSRGETVVAEKQFYRAVAPFPCGLD